MGFSSIPGLADFLNDYPRMALRPEPGTAVVLTGWFDFTASFEALHEVTDCFALSITVPADFPRDLPCVKETGGRIPNDGKHHVNQDDGTLCLGSPIRLLWTLSKTPTLVGFADNCLVPYLYAISETLRRGLPFVFGELAHGTKGEIADYTDMLGLTDHEKTKQAVKLLGVKKRLANKQQCPCGCGTVVGKCGFNFRLRPLRKIASRQWFRTVMVRIT